MKNFLKVLEIGTSDEKINLLEILENTDNPEIIKKIIQSLNDDDIRVRGEAFSSLLLNKNKISDILIDNLSSDNKNIRGFTALALANRNEITAIPEIRKLVNDDSSMVRSCMLGALLYLKDNQAKEIFLESLSDSNLEVKKGALQAITQLKIPISNDRLEEISIIKDKEIEKIVSKLKNSGPEGI